METHTVPRGKRLTRLADNPVLQRLAAVASRAASREPDSGLRAFIERRCPLTGKTRFATKAEARAFIASTPNLTAAYRCNVCAAWHVATRRRGQ